MEVTDLFKRAMARESGPGRNAQGGVIMDVTNAEQAHIAEEAGACAVMALERVPRTSGRKAEVARMASPKIIREIMKREHPVMAKVRIGHFCGSCCARSAGGGISSTKARYSHPPTRKPCLEARFQGSFRLWRANLGEALRRIAKAPR